MEQKDYTGIVPEQYTGKKIEAEASVELNNDSEATIFYQTVKERLLNVNSWHKVAGLISAVFNLLDEHGEAVNRKAEKGDFIRVDIPGPGSKAGDGYDWVYIEELKEVSDENIQSIGFRVRPSHNPLGNKNETAHFYSPEATSSFIVKREMGKITACVFDHNLKPNQHPGSLTDKIRDTSVGAGAIGMFSKLQWQNLAEGLVKK